jgi:hypothetical protein
MPRIPKGTPTSRLNLEMSEKVRQRLEALREKTDADSLAEVVRRALTVYDLLCCERARGAQLIVRGPEGEKELVLI